MKKRIQKIVSVLTMLILLAMPAQAFAADDNSNSNQTNVFSVNTSKIFCQPALVNKGNVVRYAAGTLHCIPLGTFQLLDDQTASQSTSEAVAAEATNAALDAYEQKVVELVNLQRAAAGISPLKVNIELSAVAELKAEDMRDYNYFSHTSPNYGTAFEMMKQFGISYASAGENLAKGHKTSQAVVEAWMGSAGHKANILNAEFTEIGVGYVKDSDGTTYWVQHFISR